jgi:hypothetical protein
MFPVVKTVTQTKVKKRNYTDFKDTRSKLAYKSRENHPESSLVFLDKNNGDMIQV